MSLKNPRRASGPGESHLEGFLDKGVKGNRRQRRRDRRNRGLARKVMGPLIIVCAVLAVLVAVDYGLNSGKIYSGVQVGTVPLGGKTPAEAREIIAERTSGALKEIEFTGPENFQLTAGEMGVDFDVDATVENAYSVGRRGGVLDRLGERARATYGTIEVSPEVDYRPEIAQARVESLAERVNKDPENASVNIVGSGVQAGGSSEGYELRVPATMERVNRAVEDLTGEVALAGRVLEPQVLTAEAEEAAGKAREAMAGNLTLTAEGNTYTFSPADIGGALDIAEQDGRLQASLNRDRMNEVIGGVYADLEAETVEASYDVRGAQISVVPGQTGKKVEGEKLLDEIENGIFNGKREYAVPVVTTEPELSTEEANAMMPTTLLADYRTNYAIVDDPGGQRKENLEIASGAVNGTLVAPGEIFSMNDTVSHLDYNATKVIVDGQETKADGGGLCQVTSTLYMAANFAGLNVIERSPHHSQLPYIRPGLDATVWFGDAYGNGELDMTFENTTDGYLLLREYVADDGHIYAEIYGKPNGTEVTMRSRPTHMGADYSQWVTYKTVAQNGQVTYDGVLHKDTYQPLIDEKGKTIKPSDVYVPPVDP